MEISINERKFIKTYTQIIIPIFLIWWGLS